mgnify:CR=1 FL=1
MRNSPQKERPHAATGKTPSPAETTCVPANRAIPGRSSSAKQANQGRQHLPCQPIPEADVAGLCRIKCCLIRVIRTEQCQIFLLISAQHYPMFNAHQFLAVVDKSQGQPAPWRQAQAGRTRSSNDRSSPAFPPVRCTCTYAHSARNWPPVA